MITFKRGITPAQMAKAITLGMSDIVETDDHELTFIEGGVKILFRGSEEMEDFETTTLYKRILSITLTPSLQDDGRYLLATLWVITGTKIRSLTIHPARKQLAELVEKYLGEGI